MKRQFIFGLLIGIVLTIGAFWAQPPYANSQTVRQTKSGHAEPEWWLLPKDFTLAKVYTPLE